MSLHVPSAKLAKNRAAEDQADMHLEKCLIPFCVFFDRVSSVVATRFYFCNDPQCDLILARSECGDPEFNEENAPSSPQCTDRLPLYLTLPTLPRSLDIWGSRKLDEWQYGFI